MPVARTAEYSIKGYLYQFLRYLAEILAAENGTVVTIEGAIEDIDVVGPSLTRAVQCKYHEQAEKFTLGKIYKPILLMLEHFSNNAAPIPLINYRLFCYFQGEAGTRVLTREELDTVLATDAKALTPIVARIAPGADYDTFLQRFTIEFGPSTEDLQRSVRDSLRAAGFGADDIDAIIYPSAIQQIVELATGSAIIDRTVNPVAFLAGLREVRQVTFTRWTRELATKEEIFKRLRRELKPSLNLNSRSRFFIVDPTTIGGFDDDIVKFIKKFADRYSSKFLHSNPPLFAIVGDYSVDGLHTRLWEAGMTCASGFVGGDAFRSKNLFRKPMRQRSPFRIEFRVRVAKRSIIVDDPPDRPDELFLINVSDDTWVHADVNVHKFEIERLSDLEYALQLRDNYA